MAEVDPLDAALSTPSDEPVQPPEGQGQLPADAAPSAVQPEGQGQPDATAGLYDLSTITDPAVRTEVERIAKDIDRNVNAKLQEAAEFRKNFEPFQQIGLHEYDPEGVSALLQFASKLADEDPSVATEAILNLAQSLEIDLGVKPADPADEDPATVALKRVEALEAQLAEREDAREEARLRQEAEVSYRAEYAEVEKANGKPFSEKPGPNGELSEKAQLIALARRFQADHDEPIKAAFEFISSIAGKAETALVDNQPTPPVAAEPVGRASSTVEPVTSFEDAERLHRERNASVHA